MVTTNETPELIIGLDPGPTHSAFVVWDTKKMEIVGKQYNENKIILSMLPLPEVLYRKEIYVIEKVACMGQVVGASVFETVFWSGKFAQKISSKFGKVDRMTRMVVKNTLCHSSRAKDGNIRQALIDKIGPVGTKKNPGPCFGMAGHLWSSLAVCIAYDIKLKQEIQTNAF
jgi:hypothetical protein